MAQYLLIRLRLTVLFLLALAGPIRAQTPSAAAPARPAATDVILRLDGQEIPGRVVLITPIELSYLPAPTAGTTAGPDTLRLPVAQVFLVRYANGTKEVLTQPGAGLASNLGDGRLSGLTNMERRQLGQADAKQHYQGQNVFWGTVGSTMVLGPGYGAGSTAIIAGHTINTHNLHAPVPALLQDPDYKVGYVQQARHIKRRKAWGGYGTGTGVWVAVLVLAFASSFSIGH